MKENRVEEKRDIGVKIHGGRDEQGSDRVRVGNGERGREREREGGMEKQGYAEKVGV